MNKPQTCIPLQENAQQPHRKKKKKKRLIDRGEETALSGGVGWGERGEEGRKPGNERMAGRPKC